MAQNVIQPSKVTFPLLSSQVCVRSAILFFYFFFWWWCGWGRRIIRLWWSWWCWVSDHFGSSVRYRCLSAASGYTAELFSVTCKAKEWINMLKRVMKNTFPDEIATVISLALPSLWLKFHMGCKREPRELKPSPSSWRQTSVNKVRLIFVLRAQFEIQA